MTASAAAGINHALMASMGGHGSAPILAPPPPANDSFGMPLGGHHIDNAHTQGSLPAMPKGGVPPLSMSLNAANRPSMGHSGQPVPPSRKASTGLSPNSSHPNAAQQPHFKNGLLTN